MVHKPRRLLSHTNRTLNLVRANAVFAVNDLPHRDEPLVHAKWRIFKNRPRLERELTPVVALVALPTVVLLLKGNVGAPASRASHAIWPSTSYDVLAAIGRMGEKDHGFLKGKRLHKFSMTSAPWSCQLYLYPNLSPLTRDAAGPRKAAKGRDEAAPERTGERQRCGKNRFGVQSGPGLSYHVARHGKVKSNREAARVLKRFSTAACWREHK